MPREDDPFRLHPDTAAFVAGIQRAKYMQSDEEHWEDLHRRVAEAVFPKLHGHKMRHFQGFLGELNARRACPAGRILAGAGTAKNVTLFNCFLAPLLQDSMRTDPTHPGKGIMDTLADVAYSMQMGGGVGTDFSPLRPKGALVKRIGQAASGPLAFMDMWDAMCRTVMSAGSRRGAMMATLRVDHPDMLDFITAKHAPNRLRMFNMSVLVTDAFMRAVKDDEKWELGHREPAFNQYDMLGQRPVDTVDGIAPWYVYRRLPARELWDAIMRSTYGYAEPGVIFIDRINRMNNLWYCEEISCTNPCVIGETLIAVAGRGPVPIVQLAEEGKDVPVYTCNEKTGEIVVRWGRNPRLTQRNVPILRIGLDDGTFLRVTPDHEFPLHGGIRVRACDLEPCDSLYRFDAIDTKQDGVAIGPKSVERRLEYRLIAEAKYGRKFNFGRRNGQFNVHHVDDDHFNNSWDNIEVETVNAHSSHHRLGNRNPMRDGWWNGLTNQEKDAYRKNMSESQSGVGNGMYGRKHSESTLQKIGAKTAERAKDPGYRERWLKAMQAGRERMTPEARSRNHKVVSICPDGFADVYNLTVDEHHNYAVITGETITPRWGNGHRSGVFIANCGEQALAPDDACNLCHVNLSRCVAGTPFTDSCEVDFAAIECVARLLVRQADNIIDISPLPTEAQRISVQSKRRIGLGFTGLANLMMFVRVRYGSPESCALTADVARTIRDAAYRESIELAKELSPFPLFDRDKYLQGAFIKTLPDDIRAGIAEHGIRNALLTSLAPTGTVSIAQGDNCSSGIEPVFNARYTRKVLQPDDSFKESQVEDLGFRVFANVMFDGDMDRALTGPLPNYMVTTADLTPDDHLRVMAAAQPYVDNSISKTLNVSTETPFEDFVGIYDRAYELGCKSCTTYREVPESGRGSVLSAAPAMVVEVLVEAAGKPMETHYDPDRSGLRKRPDKLTGETVRLRWGTLPYPMFLTMNDEVQADGRRVPYEVFINSKAVDYAHWVSALTRMISAVMRKGGDLSFIPDELKAVWSARGGQHVGQRFVPSEVALIGMALEQHFRDIGYLPPKEEPIAITSEEEVRITGVHYAEIGVGRECSACGALQVIRSEGCDRCLACGWSNCG